LTNVEGLNRIKTIFKCNDGDRKGGRFLCREPGMVGTGEFVPDRIAPEQVLETIVDAHEGPR
jgi:hypothetical protein